MDLSRLNYFVPQCKLRTAVALSPQWRECIMPLDPHHVYFYISVLTRDPLLYLQPVTSVIASSKCMSFSWPCWYLPSLMVIFIRLKQKHIEVLVLFVWLLPFWSRSSDVCSHLSTSPRSAQEGTDSCTHCNQGFSNTIEASEIYSAFQYECFGLHLSL